MISKKPEYRENHQRNFEFFQRCRDAFSAVLKDENIVEGDKILLPAYIGWSPKEGSGVYDPIEYQKITPVFYRMDEKLQIDLSDAEQKIMRDNIRAILIIHYFGFPDRNYLKLTQFAKEHGVLVIEDAAHAMLSDFIFGSCGRAGDYTIYSLHKMLPFNNGGMLTTSGNICPTISATDRNSIGDPFSYDLCAISKKRRKNFDYILRRIDEYERFIHPLFKELPDDVVPQSFPILISGYDRFQLYNQMNSEGFGLISLYHTLIKPLQSREWTDSQYLSTHIMNLPVHQDIQKSDYDEMFTVLSRYLV